ncbi:hypothetical protein GQ42DRAFT_179755 [Ramicandelaber brevisporus]|nr:hypothetical protein GQ42DRAFT_179755 [Ramicandelaber brevisporus]
MPPKRRCTITKPSTSLDSLRDKIRRFADTADEEHLREVAQLIDRLTISNNEPFRLLDLPYELLEYTAQRYFTRKEAVPILPVNRVFNELFANSIWNSVEFDDMMVNGCIVSPVVLMKNARRIRSVKLWSIWPNSFVSTYFPFTTAITFELKDSMETMFTLHLEQMKFLRRVILTINMLTDVINSAAEWIDDSSRSGHVQQIVISAMNHLYFWHSDHVLASLMDKIKFKKRIRLESEEMPRSCHGEINKLVFGTDPESVFVHLHTLSVQVCCNKSGLYDFQSFVPERFPVLSCLTMSIPWQSCNGDVDTPLMTIFSNKQWPSVTELELVGEYTMIPEAGRLLFKAMRALQSCAFQYMADIDISSGIETSLSISRLSLAYTDLKMSHIRGKLACLVYLELNDIEIDSNHLQFIASCMRLVEIKLADCKITDDAITTVYKYPCNSVRKAIFSEYESRMLMDRIAHLLPAFPNLRILDFTHIYDIKERISFVLKGPSVKILT